MPLAADTAYIAVEALASDGRVLATSKIVAR